MSNIVGIDLGTTFSGIARLNSIGRPEIIPNLDGERITPSLVWFPQDDPGTSIVGTQAKHARGTEWERVITQIKRRMGDLDYRTTIDGKEWSPAEISALILAKLTREAAHTAGDIRQVVISVPAYFAEQQRKATMDAGAIAGLDVVGIINEPTAAALHYATSHDLAGKVLVYDLGGGTFDVTVMDVHGTNIDIVSSQGDHKLGGVDFDEKVLELLRDRYVQQRGEPLGSTTEDLAKYSDLAERIKKSLSSRERVRDYLDGPAGSCKIEVSRVDFEERISTLIGRTEMLIEAALNDANLQPSDITKVLLVGGSCRIPLVQERLKALFGFQPSIEVNVDECVALGAALSSGLRAIQSDRASVSAGIREGLKDVQLKDVCNHSYGTVVLGDNDELKNDILIPKNTPLPFSVEKIYYTVKEGQQVIDVQITQGEGDDPDFVNIIHEERLQLPPNRPRGRPVDVTYSYDENQRMHCRFTDRESGRTIEVTLSQEESGGFDAEQIARSRGELEDFVIE